MKNKHPRMSGEEIRNRAETKSTRICSRCKQEKPLSEFYVNRHPRCLSDTYGRNYCKACSFIHRREYHAKNKDRLNAECRAWRKGLRIDVINHYGGKCVCCGEDNFQFLALDHINGGGKGHRRGIHSNLTVWCKRNNYPKDIQILCHNCNMAKSRYGGGKIHGVCPHTTGEAMTFNQKLEKFAEEIVPDLNYIRCGKCGGAKDLEHTLACKMRSKIISNIKEALQGRGVKEE